MISKNNSQLCRQLLVLFAMRSWSLLLLLRLFSAFICLTTVRMRNILLCHRVYPCVYVMLRTCPMQSCVYTFAYLLLVSVAHRVKININAIVDSWKLMNGLCVDSNERGAYNTHSRNSFPLWLWLWPKAKICFNGTNKDNTKDCVEQKKNSKTKWNSHVGCSRDNHNLFKTIQVFVQ